MPQRDSTNVAGTLMNLEPKTAPLSGQSPRRTKGRRLLLYITATLSCSAALVVVAILAGTFLDATIRCEETVLHPPNNITVIYTSPSWTRISWAPANTTCGKIIEYDVEVCVTHESCVAGSSGKHCTKHRTEYSWLVLNSTVGTSYCIQVTARAQCGDDVLNSTPTFKEIKTPLYAPGDFEVTASATSPSSVLLIVWVPLIKNGALDCCYITYTHTGGGRSFSCNDHGGNASTVEVEGLKPQTGYAFTVTFANIHGGREISTSKVISVTTSAAALNADEEATDNSGHVIWLIICGGFIFVSGEKRPRKRHRRRRR